VRSLLCLPLLDCKVLVSSYPCLLAAKMQRFDYCTRGFQRGHYIEEGEAWSAYCQ
jgi:hypothetical protein